jgi:hypothetical protein
VDKADWVNQLQTMTLVTLILLFGSALCLIYADYINIVAVTAIGILFIVSIVIFVVMIYRKEYYDLIGSQLMDEGGYMLTVTANDLGWERISHCATDANGVELPKDNKILCIGLSMTGAIAEPAKYHRLMNFLRGPVAGHKGVVFDALDLDTSATFTVFDNTIEISFINGAKVTLNCVTGYAFQKVHDWMLSTEIPKNLFKTK